MHHILQKHVNDRLKVPGMRTKEIIVATHRVLFKSRSWILIASTLKGSH